ncbi:MAG: UDP-N-acetylglucosamine 1-carboxyvinyltransferase, partial [Phycisphaerales bacterium]|nr:UDP-N-acetylglucosamine 1-carboxyvinyltransferase [Phycisphaerales bacterium]
MDTFIIEGGRRLDGTIRINGSKNAALPLMAAALLTDQPVTLRGVPNLADIANMRRLLAELGVEIGDNNGGMRLHVTDETGSHARYDIVRTMRASICALGPMLARRGSARVSMPGGCAIGDRPVDLHLRGMEALGAEIELEGGDIIARVPGGAGGRLKGDTIFLGGAFGSTVLGTANVMSAATLAEGTTVIESAACEPEVVDLARLLTAMGAKIEGAGSPRISIHGVESLGGADHAVIPDRIEAATYMCAAAITNGSLVLEDCPLDTLLAVRDRLEAVGVRIELLEPCPDMLRCLVRVTAERVLRPIEVTTQPHPGFPTDVQAQLMALLCLADGN